MIIGSGQEKLYKCFFPGGTWISFFRRPQISSCASSDLKKKLQLIYHQSHNFCVIYNELCEASVWSITLTVFSNTSKQQISQNKFGVVPPLLLLQDEIVWLRHRTFNGNESVVFEECYTCEMLLKVNYLVANEGKSLICRIFIDDDRSIGR